MVKRNLGSSWHWYRYEYAVQRGSIHRHAYGVAKLKNDPGLCQLTETALKASLAVKRKDTSKESFSKQQLYELDYDINQGKEAEKIVCQYADVQNGILAHQMKAGQNQTNIPANNPFSICKQQICTKTTSIY